MAEAPDWMGADPAAYRYDCVFLNAPLTADKAVTQIATTEEVDRVAAGPGVLYFSKLVDLMSQRAPAA